MAAASDRGFRRAHRLRSQALWAFTLAGVLGAAILVGVAQYLSSGVVSIRGGHAPASGPAALELLGTLLFVSVALAAIGVALRRRARRHLNGRERR